MTGRFAGSGLMLAAVVAMTLAPSAAADTAQQGAVSGKVAAQAPEPVPPESVSPDILVVGRLPRCRPRPGDPLDSVDLAAAAAKAQQQVIKRDPASGDLALFPDDDPVTGPGVWQRAGTRLDQYVFRVPEDGSPLCIGTRDRRAPGWGQLRQVVDATPYHGKIVRVTMWAASREAGRVWFWVASGRAYRRGAPRMADMAAESGSVEFRGTRQWTPVSLTMGPVRCDQDKLSFGALLDGAGDLWIYDPELTVVGEQSEREARRDCNEAMNRRASS